MQLTLAASFIKIQVLVARRGWAANISFLSLPDLHVQTSAFFFLRVVISEIQTRAVTPSLTNQDYATASYKFPGASILPTYFISTRLTQ